MAFYIGIWFNDGVT